MDRFGIECKKLMLTETQEKLKDASAIFFTSFQSMSVAEQEQLRGRLDGINASLFIVKNRIEAGEVAAEALDVKDTSCRRLKEYKKRTDRKIGADMKWGPWLRRLALNTEKDQERVVTMSIKDAWFANMTRDMIVGNIRYDRFLRRFLSRPDKVFKFYQC